MTLIPEVEAQSPRTSTGLPGGYMAPGSGAYPPRNVSEASRSQRNPRVKTCIPRADSAGNRNVTSFVRVGMQSLHATHDIIRLCDPWIARSF
jgi:hypothetical protein